MNVQQAHFDKTAGMYIQNISPKAYNYYLKKNVGSVLFELKYYFGLDDVYLGWIPLNDFLGLDVGCGNGDFTKILAKYCRFIYGCDISKEMIGFAKQLKPLNSDFFIADAESIAFFNNHFDFVINKHLLHHLADKKKIVNCLLEMKRVLKIGGLLIILDLNSSSPFAGIIENLMKQKGVDAGNEVLVEKSFLKKTLKDLNFEVLVFKNSLIVPHFFPKQLAFLSFLEKTPLSFLCKEILVVCKKRE